MKHQYYYTRYHYVNETEFEMFREKQTPHACMSYFIFLMQMIFSHVISAVNEAFSYKTACFIFRAVLAESSRNHQCHCETGAPVQISSSFISFFFPRCVSRFCLCFSRAWYSWKHKYHHLMCTWRRFQLCTFRRGTILTITRNSSLESMPQNSLLTILHKKSYTWQVRSICLFY